MADITSGCIITEVAPNAGLKMISIETAATADAAATVSFVLGSYGIGSGGFLGICENVHTTDASVVRQVGGSINADKAGYSTTAVASGKLTITLGTGTNLTHTFLIWGK